MFEKTFGYREPNINYKERIGAYGIGFNSDKKIPVIMTYLDNGEKGYFLLGGKIEDDEKHADCIKREA